MDGSAPAPPTRRRTAVPVAVIAVAAALVALLVYGTLQKNAEGSSTLDDAVLAGERPAAPDRALPRLGAGGTASLADFRGKVVVLNFWASWCEPCEDEMPLLVDWQRRAAPRGGTVVGVTVETTTEAGRAFLARFGARYPNLRDVGRRLADEYDTIALPETFVLDRDGRVAAIRRGPVTEAFLREEVEPLLAEGA